MTKLLAGIFAVSLILQGLSTSSADAGFGLGVQAPTSYSILHKASDCDEDYAEHEDDDEDDEGHFVAYHKRPARRASTRGRAAERVSARSTRASRAKGTKMATPKAMVAPKFLLKPINAPVEMESSSIATATDRVAATRDAGCKNYFASVGMTLSVGCE
jgi:hypothetical protein